MKTHWWAKQSIVLDDRCIRCNIHKSKIKLYYILAMVGSWMCIKCKHTNISDGPKNIQI
jgi:hypothetical protein